MSPYDWGQPLPSLVDPEFIFQSGGMAWMPFLVPICLVLGYGWGSGLHSPESTMATRATTLSADPVVLN